MREDRLEELRCELAASEKYTSYGLRFFLSLVGISCVDTLEFHESGHDFFSEYCGDDEGLVQALKAPWSEPDAIAAWLARYVRAGGRMTFHSVEGNGNDFAYAFDGRGRCRYLVFKPIEKWFRPQAPDLVDPPAAAKRSPRPRSQKVRRPQRRGAAGVDRAHSIIGGLIYELDMMPGRLRKK